MKKTSFLRWGLYVFIGCSVATACGSDGESSDDGDEGGPSTGGRPNGGNGGSGNSGGEATGGENEGGDGGTSTGGASAGSAGAGDGGGGTDGGEAGGGAGGTGGSATGGSGGMSGGGMGGSGGQRVGCGTPNLIDDMEDGDATLCLGSGREGGWYNAKNPNVGTIIPDVGVVVMPSLLIPARGTSTRGIHFQGSGFGTTGEWGLVGIGVNATGGAPYDASIHQGITFWGKSDQSSVTINVKFATVASTDSQFNGSCVPTTIPCGDHWQATRTLTGAWQQFTVYFPNNLTQLGWGVPVPKDLAHLLGIEFFFASSASQSGFDFWIDDVEFY